MKKIIILLILLFTACTPQEPPETPLPPAASPTATITPVPSITHTPTWLPDYVTPTTGTPPTHIVFVTATKIAEEAATSYYNPTPTQKIWAKGIINVIGVETRNEPRLSSYITGILLKNVIVTYNPNDLVLVDGYEWIQIDSGNWITLEFVSPIQ